MSTEQQPKRRMGPHLGVRDGLLKAADRAQEIGATAVQVFTDNPTAWKRRPELPEELAEFRRRLAAADIGPIAIHAPYLINLCGADADFWVKSVATVATELRVGAAYGASFVNVHIGSHRGLGRDEGLKRLGRGLRRILDEVDGIDDLPLLVLENAPGSGDGIGSSIEDLADILQAASADDVPEGQVGFCLDSAHLWAAGHRIDGIEGVGRLVDRIDQILGRERVAMLHLNDARTLCGSRVDRHEHIGAGQIGEHGLGAFLTEPWLRTLPAFLETPGMDGGYDLVNLDRARRLIAGELLEPMPADAFAARGSRSRRASAAASAE